MDKKIIFFILLFFFMESIFGESFNLRQECDGTQFRTDTGLVYIPKGEVKEVVIGGIRYRCVGCGGCTAVSSSQSSNLSLSQQMAMGLVGTMINSVFGGMFNNLFSPPSSSSQNALIRQQQEKQWRQEQEEKLAAYNQWLIMQEEAEQKRLEEQRKNKQIGEEILAKSSLSSGEVKRDFLGEGRLAPINWDAPRLPEVPASSGQYDTSGLSEVERLLCASFFSKMAENAARSGDLEAAIFYGAQMDNVMQGLPTAVECKLPRELAAMTVDTSKLEEMNQKYARMAELYAEVVPRIEKLRDIEIKLEEVIKAKSEKEKKIIEIDGQIEKIRERAKMADNQQKKAQEDELLAQALALRSEADRQYQEAAKMEEQLIKEKQNIEQDLNKIKEYVQKGGLR